ncbi:MAG: glutamine amidotransferase [Planctomycetota bacterium]|nr:glutamine amidotransferase [Planctomycetota bacterium]
MQIIGDKSGAITATKQMVVGDMPDFGSSMQLGLQGLTNTRAGQKHMIIISDGDPSPPSRQLLQTFVDNQITVTTVMVAGHGSMIDRNNMKAVSDTTGGTFYNVTNPKNLPQIFIKEAQLVSRSLIQEETIQPQVVSRLPGPIEGFSRVPAIDGFVLTAQREGLAQSPIVNATEEGNDPIYAHWNYGLGKSIAYTSDLTGRWGSPWVSWSEFQAFWEQSIRWVMRPNSPRNMIVNTRMEGELAIVEIEALEADASFLDFMQTQAVVLDPNSDAEPLNLQQIGPGRYRGEFNVDQAGAYLININYAGGSVESPIRGNLQAAVTVPYSREFRTVKHNAALLQELAERTGGRMLQAGDPMLVDLFNRDQLEVPKSPKYIWDLLLIIAASMFLLDVAARRLTIDPVWIAGLFGRAVKAREDATTQSVSAWKKAKAQASYRQTSSDKVRQEEIKASRSVRYESGEDDEQYAYDVESDVPNDQREGQMGKPPKVAPKSQEEEDDGDFTSRLLAAKKRARQEGDLGDGKSGGSGGSDA